MHAFATHSLVEKALRVAALHGCMVCSATRGDGSSAILSNRSKSGKNAKVAARLIVTTTRHQCMSLDTAVVDKHHGDSWHLRERLLAEPEAPAHQLLQQHINVLRVSSSAAPAWRCAGRAHWPATPQCAHFPKQCVC